MQLGREPADKEPAWPCTTYTGYLMDAFCHCSLVCRCGGAVWGDTPFAVTSGWPLLFLPGCSRFFHLPQVSFCLEFPSLVSRQGPYRSTNVSVGVARLLPCPTSFPVSPSRY